MANIDMKPLPISEYAKLAESALRRGIKSVLGKDCPFTITSLSLQDDEGKGTSRFLIVYFDLEDGGGGVWHFKVDSLLSANEDSPDLFMV